MAEMTDDLRDKIDAQVFRRLVSHLDSHKEVQNIDLMILADFCRNCLGDWYAEAAREHGLEIGKEEGRARIYGMPYAEWKEKFQTPATPEQIAAFEARKQAKSG